MSSAVDNLADNLASASIQDPSSTANDTVLASAAEGRRLYIGNLAYATTEGELKDFFSAYKVYVRSSHARDIADFIICLDLAAPLLSYVFSFI
jgi:RNA recognition motif-containing protein